MCGLLGRRPLFEREHSLSEAAQAKLIAHSSYHSLRFCPLEGVPLNSRILRLKVESFYLICAFELITPEVGCARVPFFVIETNIRTAPRSELNHQLYVG